jgi:hypothetical protein
MLPIMLGWSILLKRLLEFLDRLNVFLLLSEFQPRIKEALNLRRGLFRFSAFSISF